MSANRIARRCHFPARFSTLLAALLICAGLGCPAAHADQLRFTGQTTADETLIRDALRTVMLLARARHNCAALDRVDAEILPPAYVPPGGPRAEGSNKTIYERWTATLCGKEVPYLVGMWAASQGGTMFRVQELPADVRAR